MIGFNRVDNVSLLVEILSFVGMDRDVVLWLTIVTPTAVVSAQKLERVTTGDNSSALVVQQG